MEKINRSLDEALNFQSRYCYNESNVLINKLNIHDQKTLDKAERNITALMLMKLQLNPIPNPKELFSVEYFINLHKQVFEYIYPFAGTIRKENMVKGNKPFCRPDFIYKYLTML